MVQYELGYTIMGPILKFKLILIFCALSLCASLLCAHRFAHRYYVVDRCAHRYYVLDRCARSLCSSLLCARSLCSSLLCARSLCSIVTMCSIAVLDRCAHRYYILDRCAHRYYVLNRVYNHGLLFIKVQLWPCLGNDYGYLHHSNVMHSKVGFSKTLTPLDTCLLLPKVHIYRTRIIEKLIEIHFRPCASDKK